MQKCKARPLFKFKMHIHRILVVQRKSLYQIYVEEHAEGAVRRAISKGDRVARLIKRGHEIHHRSREKLLGILNKMGLEVEARWRGQLRKIHGFDLVISVGGDGTLLEVARLLSDHTPLMGINSDPSHSVGALCSTTVDGVANILEELAVGKRRPKTIFRMRSRIDGKEVLGPTLNDVLFAHQSPAGFSRFDVAIVPEIKALSMHSAKLPHRFIHYKGSGLWVATGIGSSGALYSAGGKKLPIGSRMLQYLVREPFTPPKCKRPPKFQGMVHPGEALVVICRLRRGMIWSDGSHHHRSIAYGQQIVFDANAPTLKLVR